MAKSYHSDNQTFGLLPEEKRGFKSLGLSALINIAIAILILVISMSAVHVVQHTHLVANEIVFQPQQTRPVTPPPAPPKPHIHLYAPRTQPSKIFTPRPKPVKPAPKVAQATPRLPLPNIPAAAPQKVAPPPKPKVGLFKSVSPAPAEHRAHSTVHAVNFGNPVGSHPNPNTHRRTTRVAFGSSENVSSNSKPHGSVHGVNFGSSFAHGARGGHNHRAIASASFGNNAFGSAGHSHREIASAAFGNHAFGGSGHKHGQVASAAFGGNMYGNSGHAAHHRHKPHGTPIIVLSKPLPKYTQAALQKHVQGQVTLRVRFTATGQVQILNVVHGLGYGLNHRAEIAAEHIRFKPATQNGHPINAVRIIRITFQMT